MIEWSEQHINQFILKNYPNRQIVDNTLHEQKTSG